MNRNTAALRVLWKEAFGDGDAFLDAFFKEGFSEERCCTVEEEGRLAGAVYWFDCVLGERKAAYLYALAVAGEFRGRGLGRALMEMAHRKLEEKGYTMSILVPGEPGLRGMYEKMGYRTCTRITEFRCKAGEETLLLRKIGTAEYARRRRELLGPGGVIQEGANLAFLAAQWTLYAGEKVLLAAAREGDALACPELLGEQSLAPGIVKTLGCREGNFRVPGTEMPFAMYRPITEGPAPEYFGLAFD